MRLLNEEIINCVNNLKDEDFSLRQKYLQRVAEGNLTRDENPVTHFCVYFFPFNPVAKQVFLVHHKKANKWIPPGGHINKGENLWQALNREISEELGVSEYFKEQPIPFLLTITPINQSFTCKEHFDVWFLLKTNGADFQVNAREFYNTGWFSRADAKEIVVDDAITKALLYLENSFEL
jgi:8-oxo-dGTP pyrophosphatase MutT (NUDIX family)